jgi:hypothetical protein
LHEISCHYLSSGICGVFESLEKGSEVNCHAAAEGEEEAEGEETEDGRTLKVLGSLHRKLRRKTTRNSYSVQ